MKYKSALLAILALAVFGYTWTTNKYYMIIAVAWLLASVLALQSGLRLPKIHSPISFIIFIPTSIYPLLSCYYRLPYVFCRNCPRKCAFGYIRPYVLGSVILINRNRKHWCVNMCPIGQIQEITVKNINLPPYPTPYLVLLLAVTAVVFSSIAPFFMHPLTNLIIVILFLISLFVPRFWCRYVCPISKITSKDY